MKSKHIVSERDAPTAERHQSEPLAHSGDTSTPLVADSHEEMFRQMVEIVGQVFWLADPSVTRLSYVSPAYEEVWGRKRESLYQSTESWATAIHPEDRARAAAFLAEPVTDPRSTEYRILRPGRSVRWISDRRFPLRDSLGEILKVAGIAEDITERKHTQAALRDSEEQYRLLVEQSSDGIFLADRNGNLIFGNSRAREMLGYTVEEFARLNISETYVPEERELAEQKVRELQPGRTQLFERQMRRKDGTAFPVEISLRLVREGWCQAVVRDITERKRAEEALAHDRNLLRTLIETLPDRICVKDENTRFLLNNIAHLRALGAKSQEEVLGKTDFDFLPAELAAQRTADDHDVLKNGRALNNREEAITLPNGEPGWVLASKVPLRDTDGKVIGLVGISRDITDRKRIEEALEYERDLLRAMMDYLPDHIYFKDRDSRFIRVSRAHAKHFRLKDPSEALGKTDFDFFTPEHAQPAFDDEQRMLRSGQSIIGKEEKETHPDGRVTWVSTTKEPLRDANGNIIGTFGISRDITDRKEAEEKLKTYAERLEQSNRDLQDFAYIASHDLQEPLRKIQAFGDRLKAKYSDALGEGGRDYLGRMFDAAARMQTLINDLLSFSRVTTKAQPFAAVDLDKVLQEVLSDLEVRIEQTHGRIETGPLGTIDADALQMRQLFQNLIGNALKFHKENESPVIQVRSRLLNGEYPARIEVSVSDNGIGFDQKYTDRIFGIFQRLHGRGQYEGTGVGLAICKKIVERHDGAIAAEGRPGQGATFIVTLPAKHPNGENNS